SSGNYSRPIAAVKSVFNRTSRMRRSWLKPIVRACRRGQFLVKLKTQQKTPLKAAAQLLDLTREFWGDRWDSNPRQPESQSGTLPTELRSPLLDKPKIGSAKNWDSSMNFKGGKFKPGLPPAALM